jgi:hypothetical protein
MNRGFGIFAEPVAADLVDLCRGHRAKTYYQGGLTVVERAETMYALAQEVKTFIVGRSAQGHKFLRG